MKTSPKTVPLEHTAITKVLPFLKAYKARWGFMPTNREIATEFSKASPWWGSLVLQKLAAAKLIKIKPGKHRGITIL